MPVWSQMIRRDKEEELIFRGNQYARAINQYQRKFASASPPSLDVLIEQRLLRKKFKDPLSPNKDGEFQLLYLQNQATMGTQGPGRARARQVRVRGRGKAREVPVDGVALQSAARSGPRRAAAVPLSASPARTLASPSRPIRARTTTTSGSSSEWRVSTQGGPGGPPGQRGVGPQRGGQGGRDGGGRQGGGREGGTTITTRDGTFTLPPGGPSRGSPSREGR